MIKRFLLVCLVFTTALSAFAQQDAQFSQYMFNGLYINPAYAGFKQKLNVNTFFRKQWMGFEGAPGTMTLSVDAPMYDNTMGLGFQVASDKIGNSDELSAYSIYSYHLTLNDESNLAFGLGAGFYRFALNGSNAIVDDASDDLISGNKSTSFNPDVKFGVFYNTEKYYVGFSANNLLAPYLKYEPDASSIVPRKATQIYLTSGVAIPLSDNVVIKPSFLLRQEIKGYSTLDLNTFFLLYDKLWVGGGYRSSFKINRQANQPLYNVNSAVLMSELFLSENFRLGYAYDMSLSAVKNVNSGSHEISLSYSLDIKDIIPEHSPKPARITERVDRASTKAVEKEAKQKEQAAKEADRIVQRAKEQAQNEQKAQQTSEAQKAEREAREREKKEHLEKKQSEAQQAIDADRNAREAEQKKREADQKLREEKKRAEEQQVSEEERKRLEVKEKAKAEENAKREAERKLAEAKEKAKAEEEVKREEERRLKEAARENKRLEQKERDAEKVKQEVEKAKEEEMKSFETPEERKKRIKAEKEEEKQIKKIKRKKGAMVTPRYF